MSVFNLYDKMEPLIASAQVELNKLVRTQYKDIQYIKTTSINKNYMFNDSISNEFYKALGINKETLRSSINKYITSTKNFDSLDPNNILLLFIMRFGMKTGQNVLVKLTYEIFLYKNFYPIFTNYFKYGVDESAFEYFKSQLNNKYELAKQDSLYDALDAIGKRNFDKYSPFIASHSEKDFLLIPVNTKTRINQFIKELMRAYMPFIEKNKVHLNASRDLESEEYGTFNDQTYNNNMISQEYKNKYMFFIIHNDLPESLFKTIASSFKFNNEDDVKEIYKNIIKNKETSEKVVNIFVDNIDKNLHIDDKRIIQNLFLEANKHKASDYMIELDNYIKSNIKDIDESKKSILIEKRKILLILVYLIILRTKS